MSYNRIIYDYGKIIDLTEDTVTPDSITVGTVAHNKKGETINGTIPEREIADIDNHAGYVLVPSGRYRKDIDVSAELKPSALEVAIPPSKTTYTVGQKFNKTGMVVTAMYDYNGETFGQVVEGFTYSPTGKLKATNKKITIKYVYTTSQGELITLTCTLPITVTS